MIFHQVVPIPKQVARDAKETFEGCALSHNFELHEIPKHSDLGEVREQVFYSLIKPKVSTSHHCLYVDIIFINILCYVIYFLLCFICADSRLFISTSSLSGCIICFTNKAFHAVFWCILPVNENKLQKTLCSPHAEM